MSAFIQPINLRAMGFCGIDDSCRYTTNEIIVI